jgi:anti-sigma regulatory factor (Ser/Thr protein kinase)
VIPSAIILSAAIGASLMLVSIVLVRLTRRSSTLPLDNPEFQDFAGSLSMTIIVIPADLSGILYASPGFRGIFDMDPSEVDFRRLKGFIHEDDAESLESALQAGRSSSFEIEFRILRKGETHWIHMRGFPVPGDGDFIDFFDGGDEVLDLMVGDVMGKGIPAALTGAAARNAFVRARMSLGDESGLSCLPVKGIVSAAEKRMAGKLMELKTFFTLVYGRIDGNTGLFRYVDCGHTSIIHYEKRSGRCWRLKGANAPMGFLPEQDYVEYAVPVDEGDLLFLYSDGITEATNSEGEQFGEVRLLKLIRSSSGLGAAELLEKIKQITFSYAAGEFKDDVTGISIRMISKTRNLTGDSNKFPQSLASLHAIREYFDRCIGASLSASISAEARESVLIAIAEAASNIFKHNAPDEKWTCAASFRKTDSWASFSLYYHGVDYDWQEWAIPRVENFQTSGYGLYLIGEAMDSVTVSAGDDGLIRLCMLLYLSAECKA